MLYSYLWKSVCLSSFSFFPSFCLFLKEVTQAGLELTILSKLTLRLLIHIPKCWDYRLTYHVCLFSSFCLFFLSVYGPRDQTQDLAQVWWAHMLQLSYTSSALMSKVIKKLVLFNCFRFDWEKSLLTSPKFGIIMLFVERKFFACNRVNISKVKEDQGTIYYW